MKQVLTFLVILTMTVPAMAQLTLTESFDGGFDLTLNPTYNDPTPEAGWNVVTDGGVAFTSI
ncbi:MAG: hypothetical protein JXM70_09350, partial [Pirellulales bacterium]|nr:hypothetical protein [Pirellulales bacterium]